MSFFTELKRRNVIRVGLAYAVLSWLLLQVGDVLFEALRLDDSALTIMLVILAPGMLPVRVFGAFPFRVLPAFTFGVFPVLAFGVPLLLGRR